MNEIKSEFELTKKQSIAWSKLQDNIHKEILFGGSAGGGKSFIGCLFILTQALKYKETAWLIGRAKLKTLKQTTLKTFFEVATMVGLKKDVHYTYNSQASEIKLFNGSIIFLKDLFSYPSDPNFDELGSLEITGAFIDEANQIAQKAKSIVTSRIRYKLDKYGLIPKCLMTCNPARNWVYKDFYQAQRDGKIRDYRCFIPALANDNPHLSQHYIDNLDNLDDVDRERLKEGNWEYSEENMLFNIDDIIKAFENETNDSDEFKCMTIDVAREGKDKTTIAGWKGLDLFYFEEEAKSNLKDLAKKVNKLERENRLENVLADEDGVGGGLVDTAMIDGFLGGSKALDGENYQNLRTQCYCYLAKNIKFMSLKKLPEHVKELLQEELLQYKRVKVGEDGKIKITSKKEIKERIGRSPDYADVVMMRMFYQIYKNDTLTDFFSFDY